MERADLGIDLGGTTLKALLVGESGEVLRRESIPTESFRGPEGVVARIGELAARLAQGVELGGVGVGFPGLIDRKAGCVRFLPNLPGDWNRVAVRGPLEERLGCPVGILNDARMATLGELHFGRGRAGAVESMVMLTLGTGVGGGVAIDGKLRLGPLGAAGEIGHMTIVPDGPRCGCGSRGCLETLFSGPALTGQAIGLMLAGGAPILHRLAEGRPDRIDLPLVARAVREGDDGLGAVVARGAGYVGIAVASMISVLHPELVVLGGGVARLGDLLLVPVREQVRERVRMFPPDDVRIELSELDADAGLWGGVALAREAADAQRGPVPQG